MHSVTHSLTQLFMRLYSTRHVSQLANYVCSPHSSTHTHTHSHSLALTCRSVFALEARVAKLGASFSLDSAWRRPRRSGPQCSCTAALSQTLYDCMCVWSVVFLCLLLGGWPCLLLLLLLLLPAVSLYILATEILLFCVCFVLHFVSYLQITQLPFLPLPPLHTPPSLAIGNCAANAAHSILRCVCVCAPERSPTGCFKNPKNNIKGGRE